jgi:hypothetical protein
MEKIFLGLKVIEWLAIIGVFAWLPPIIQWIKDYLKRPKLTIVSGKYFDVGFTIFGPIINMSLAFLSENKKALINKVEIELVHENNDTQRFSWVWFEEVLYTIDIPDGDPLDTKRHQTAIAIKIGLDDLVEKRVGFQQDSFKIEYDKQFKQLREEERDYIQLNKPPVDLKATHSYRALHDLFSNSFFWKIGNYHIKINAFIMENNIKVSHELKFNLTNLDLKLLQSNIASCHTLLEKRFVDNTLPDIKPWDWISTTKISE